MNRKATLKDIADEVSISTAAVSMILSGKRLSRFSQDTIDAVYTVSRKLGYTAKHGKDKGGLIVIICPSVINPYFAILLQGIELEAEKNDYLTMTFNTYWNVDREKKAFEFSKNPNVRGLIFTMIPQDSELVEKIADVLPVVAVGDKNIDFHFDTVEVNNFDAGYQLGRHLISFGHKRVCYVSTVQSKQPSSRVQRYNGLCESYKQFCPEGSVNLLTNDIYNLNEISTIEIEQETGRKLTKKCLQIHPEVTAIVALNDMVAYGVIDEILEEGYRIPDDFSVCGFDNIYPSQFKGISLTTVDDFIYQRGKIAFSLMQKKLEQNVGEQNSITHFEFRNELIVRSTTGKPRQTD